MIVIIYDIGHNYHCSGCSTIYTESEEFSTLEEATDWLVGQYARIQTENNHFSIWGIYECVKELDIMPDQATITARVEKLNWQKRLVEERKEKERAEKQREEDLALLEKLQAQYNQAP